MRAFRSDQGVNPATKASACLADQPDSQALPSPYLRCEGVDSGANHMPDEDLTDDDQDDELVDDSRLVRDLRKQLKDANKALREAQEGSAKAEAMERKVAVLEAKLDLNERQQKALFASHDGEWTADALRTTAEELGFIQPSKELQDEIAAHGRVREAAQGASEVRADPVAEMDALDMSDPQYQEKVMALVSKHGGNSAWESQ